MAPKGRMPTRSMEGMGRRYVVEGGICRGIWLTRTGGWTGCRNSQHSRHHGEFKDENYSMLEAYPATCEAERNTNDKPDTQNNEHGREWHCATRSLGPQEEVEQEESSEDNSRNHDGRHGNILLPLLTAERLVDARGDIATDEAEDSIE